MNEIALIDSILRGLDVNLSTNKLQRELYNALVLRLGRDKAGYLGDGGSNFTYYHINGKKLHIIRDYTRKRWHVDTGA